MPNWGYSIQKSGLDKDKTAVASGRDLRISPKKSREVCNSIKGMMLSQAKKFLEEVIQIKTPVPFKRYNKDLPHRHGLGNRWKFHQGAFPEKPARFIYDVLANAESNAEYKGLDPDRLKIIHAATMRGRKVRRYIERAHGRSSPYFKTLTHIEIVLEEVNQ
jgi:large subunit ribosomal protein L22